MASFNTIRSRDQMKRYLMTKLGSPVINVEVDDDQMDLAIDDSLLEFWRYNAEEGSYMHYFTLEVFPGQSEYCMAGLGIEDAYDIQMSGMMDGLTTLFSPMNMFYNYWCAATGNPLGSAFPFGSAGYGNNQVGQGGSLVMAEYNTSMQYLKLVEKQLGKMYTLHFHKGREVLEIIPTPKEHSMALISLYVREEENFLFDNPLVRKLMVARAGVAWGGNLTKITGTLPDGLTINGEGILSRYLEAEEKALDDIKSQSQPADFFMG